MRARDARAEAQAAIYNSFVQGGARHATPARGCCSQLFRVTMGRTRRLTAVLRRLRRQAISTQPLAELGFLAVAVCLVRGRLHGLLCSSACNVVLHANAALTLQRQRW